jgi:hypothetical protein
MTVRKPLFHIAVQAVEGYFLFQLQSGCRSISTRPLPRSTLLPHQVFVSNILPVRHIATLRDSIPDFPRDLSTVYARTEDKKLSDAMCSTRTVEGMVLLPLLCIAPIIPSGDTIGSLIQNSPH